MATLQLPGQSAGTQAVAIVGSDGLQIGTSGNPLVTSGGVTSLGAGVNRSGTITTANTAQTLAPENLTRKSLTGQNISSADLWLNETGGTAQANTAGSFRVAAGSGFSVVTNRAISIVGATAGQAFTATET